MLDHEITALVVADDTDQAPLGLLTMTDYLKKVALAERPARTTSTGSIMTEMARTAFVFEDNDAESALYTMATVGCHHLPVLTDHPPTGQLVGVVSLPELMGLTYEQREEHLRRGKVSGHVVRYATKSATLFPPALVQLIMQARPAQTEPQLR
jgi:CBS domain-containing protein